MAIQTRFQDMLFGMKVSPKKAVKLLSWPEDIIIRCLEDETICMCAFITYSLKANGSGDGIYEGVGLREIGEVARLNTLEVHGL